MSAGVYNLTVEQGATKTLQVTYKTSTGGPVDLTGYLGRGKIRLKPADTAALASFVVTVSNSTGGIVDVVLPSTALSAFKPKGASYAQKTSAAYDVEIYNETGTVIRLLNGTVDISPEVTR